MSEREDKKPAEEPRETDELTEEELEKAAGGAYGFYRPADGAVSSPTKVGKPVPAINLTKKLQQ